MQDKVYKTNELYGVFCSDGTFKIYHHIQIEGTIDCLFDAQIKPNTIIKEELRQFSPLVVYNPNEENSTKTIYWQDGRFFVINDKYYKAIRLDIIQNEFFNVVSEYIRESALKRIERVMNKKLSTNETLYKNIWKNLVICGYEITELNNEPSKKCNQEESTLANIDMLRIPKGIEKLLGIIISEEGNIRKYKDSYTGEVIYDTYGENGKILNRKYFNSKSKAIIQIYFNNDKVEYYICGINEKEEKIKSLFLEGLVNYTTYTTRHYKKRQRLKERG